MGWLSGWSNRIKIVMNGADIESALSDFPILIKLSTSSGITGNDVTYVFDELGANRLKIAVTTSDGVSQCYVEIEKWDSSNEQAWLWARIPSIPSNVDTDLYLYYDNNQPDNTTWVGDIDSTPARNVWSNNYQLVCHMRDYQDTSHIKDSTSNGYTGTKKAANQPSVETGKISDAQHFHGNEYANLGDIVEPANVTVEAWVYHNVTGNSDDRIVAKEYGSSTPYVSYNLDVNSFATGKYGFEIGVSGQLKNIRSNTGSTAAEWRYVAGTYDKSYMRIYVNGVQENYEGFTSDILYSNQPLNVGGDIPRSIEFIDGLIDEIRISSVARSAAWIKASYESERDHLLSFGAAVPVGHTKTKIVDKDGDSGVYTTIQAALDAVNDNGGVVYVEKGEYTITAPLTIGSNVSLIGRGNVLIKIDAGSDISALKNKTQTDPGNSRIYVAGIKIESRSSGVSKHLIDFQLVSDSVLEDIHIEGKTTVSEKAGIYIKGGGGNRVSRCTVVNCGIAINLYDATKRNVVEECRVYYVYSGIVVRKNSDLNIIRNNHCSYTYTGGGDPDGILVQGCNYLAIQGNVCEACAKHGIFIQADTNYGGSKGLAIVGNVCQGNANDGISLDGLASYVMEKNTIVGNCCSSNTGNGINIQDYCRGTAVAGNTCPSNGSGTQGNGIRESGTNTGYTTIVGNTCVGNAGPEIDSTGTNSIKQHNIELD